MERTDTFLYMSWKNMKEKESKDKTVDRASLNSGLKYYDLIVWAMKQTMQANIYDELDTWARMLYQIWNWMSPFSNERDVVYNKLNNVFNQLSAIKEHSRNMNISDSALKRKIRHELLSIEKDLYMSVNYMLLPTSKGSSDTIDFFRASQG